MFDDSAPILMQLVDRPCTEVVAGTYPDGAKALSINELTVFHRISPATTNRAITLLVEQGVLIKRRGIGMFIADGVRLHLVEERRQAPVDRCVRPLITGAATLDISGRELIVFIQKGVNP